MKYNIDLFLNPCFFKGKISDRIDEVKNSAPYLEYSAESGINIFSITLNDKDELKLFIKILEDNLKNISYLPLKLEGWRIVKKRHGKSVFMKVNPGDETSDFFLMLERDLKRCGFAERLNYQNPENMFDIFVAKSRKSGEIEHFLDIAEEKISFFNRFLLLTVYSACKKPSYKIRNLNFFFDILGVSLFKDKKLYREYSLPLGEQINSCEKKAVRKSYEKYRIVKKYQSAEDSDLSQFRKNKKMFVISDLHLGHKNIIEGTGRPFDENNVKKMDEILISNWNNVVKKNDFVIFAGDLTYGCCDSTAKRYFESLNGNITFVKGNHDNLCFHLSDEYEFEYDGFKFLVIHDPKKKPGNYNGWIIHGHTHNSRIKEYPFINFKKKTINVSCELIRYHPLDISVITEIIRGYADAGCKNIDSIEHLP